MNCHEVNSDLVYWELGELSGDSKSLVESHLLECTTCLKAYIELKSIGKQIESLPSRSIPGLEKRIRDRVFADPYTGEKGFESSGIRRTRISSFKGWVITGALAAAVAVCFFTLKTWSSNIQSSDFVNGQSQAESVYWSNSTLDDIDHIDASLISVHRL